MARGVSIPRYAIQAVYFDVSWMGWSAVLDEDGNETKDEDGDDVMQFDEWSVQQDWDDWIEWNIVDPLLAKYKSLGNEISLPVRHLGDENHVLLANEHAYIGISEYIGVACAWVVSRWDYDEWYSYRDESGIARHWCESINFAKVVNPDLKHLGGMSSGEQVYHRIEEK